MQLQWKRLSYLFSVHQLKRWVIVKSREQIFNQYPHQEDKEIKGFSDPEFICGATTWDLVSNRRYIGAVNKESLSRCSLVDRGLRCSLVDHGLKFWLMRWYEKVLVAWETGWFSQEDCYCCRAQPQHCGEPPSSAVGMDCLSFKVLLFQESKVTVFRRMVGNLQGLWEHLKLQAGKGISKMSQLLLSWCVREWGGLVITIFLNG